MSKKVKETIIATVVFVFIVLISGVVGYVENHYTAKMCVSEVNGSEVTLLDKNFEEFVFIGEGYEVGQWCKVTMFTSYTDTTNKDDVVEKVKIIGLE